MKREKPYVTHESRTAATAFYFYSIGSAYCKKPLVQTDHNGDWIEFSQETWGEWDKILSVPGIKVRQEWCNAKGHVGARLNGKCYLCSLPSPRQQAKKEGKDRYVPEKPCKVCDTRAPRLVANGRCLGCHPLKPKKLSARKRAMNEGLDRYVPDEPCEKCGARAVRLVNNGRCLGCHPPKRTATPSPRQLAKQLGLEWYLPDEPCEKCGEHAERRVKDDKCKTCGDTHRAYKPTVPCPDCGTLALRYVSSGKCSGCE